MINKILTYFPNSVTQDFPPDDFSSRYYWFKEKPEDSLWIGIPVADLTDSQFELLKTLLLFIDTDTKLLISTQAIAWNQFLVQKGKVPSSISTEVRIIQFRIGAGEYNQDEVTEALQGFFPDHILLWINRTYGLLIEERSEIPACFDEFESIAATFESDLFLKIVFYIGKFQKVTEQFPVFYETEKNIFLQAERLSSRKKIFTLEKVFPSLLASRMPDTIKSILDETVLEAFRDDKDLMGTIKVFLESSSNTSLAAKKLYVHRNTLQYRLDKFVEKTGIQLKDFDSAVLVYLACIYEELP